MRLVTFSYNGADHVGVRIAERIVPLADLGTQFPNSIVQLLRGKHLTELAKFVGDYGGPGIAPADITYLPVVPRPGKILCIGRNYAAHAAEGGAETPSYPEIFSRTATSLLAHRGAIVRPQCSEKLDFEGEFAFVVGSDCRHATLDNALDCVAGYTLFNDATLRDYQRRASQWTMGKNFDKTGAFGPELVTADELPAGLQGLTLTTHLNGKEMQRGNIDDLVFPVRQLIVLLSECLTLQAGDVVVTGTPSGVGFARKPPVWMKAGDTVAVSIDGLGTLQNTVRDEDTSASTLRSDTQT